MHRYGLCLRLAFGGRECRECRILCLLEDRCRSSLDMLDARFLDSRGFCLTVVDPLLEIPAWYATPLMKNSVPLVL